MSSENHHNETDQAAWHESPQIIIATVVPEPPLEQAPASLPRRRWKLPLALFLVTCASTFDAGGWTYALCLMTILACHEAGHFVQARRYGIYSSYPFFLPMPFSPLGTFGAVIAMDSRIRDRKALFDIGITGPLAGLVPTLIFCVLGLYWSKPATMMQMVSVPPEEVYGTPLLFDLLARWLVPALRGDSTISAHPMAFAGWVGLLITALNLVPIGQLDGGHVLYALIRRGAHFAAVFLLLAAIVAIVQFHYYWWTLMVVLLTLMGPKHPPTSDDHVPLGPVRIIVGWLTLAFLVLGFTPNPFPSLPT